MVNPVTGEPVHPLEAIILEEKFRTDPVALDLVRRQVAPTLPQHDPPEGNPEPHQRRDVDGGEDLLEETFSRRRFRWIRIRHGLRGFAIGFWLLVKRFFRFGGRL